MAQEDTNNTPKNINPKCPKCGRFCNWLYGSKVHIYCMVHKVQKNKIERTTRNMLEKYGFHSELGLPESAKSTKDFLDNMGKNKE